MTEIRVISIASGKGGTGKTTIAVNLALSLTEDGQKVQFLDCDVEEPNAALFLKPEFNRFQPVGIPIPVVDEKKCTYCGKCSEVCAYNAIAVVHPVRYTKGDNVIVNKDSPYILSNGVKNKVLIFKELCHGCGGCSLFCPEGAITEKENTIGVLEEGIAKDILFIDGRLNIGEAMPTPLVKAVKRDINSERIVIIDASPGISCPVIEAVKGSDYCILVTEPTPFGLNDLILSVEMLKRLKIPIGVVINRSDIGDKKVEEYCKEEGIPVLMHIPIDREIAELYSRGIPFVEAKPEYSEKFQRLWDNIRRG